MTETTKEQYNRKSNDTRYLMQIAEKHKRLYLVSDFHRKRVEKTIRQDINNFVKEMLKQSVITGLDSHLKPRYKTILTNKLLKTVGLSTTE